jgi:predicted dienelactone hydrolase
MLLTPGVHASEPPYVVGHVDHTINVPGTTFGENRPVIVHTWYPAQAPQDCATRQPCSKTPSTYTSRLFGVPLGNLGDPLSWTISGIQAFDNLRINTEDGPFPIIVFSHGSPGRAISSAYILEALASSGFIVAAPDHVNDTLDDQLIDYANSLAPAGVTVIPCFDGFPGPCWRSGLVSEGTNTNKDRVHDVSAVISALPTWFGNQVDMSRVGVMGHSRGAQTAFAAGGASLVVSGDPPVKAIMGLAIAVVPANIKNVTLPAALIAGALDQVGVFLQYSKTGFDMMASKKNELGLIGQAYHRHFTSGLCAVTQSSGAVATKDSRAILDLQTFRLAVTQSLPGFGVAMDFCGFDTFTEPADIRSLVFSLTGFSVSPDNVPTTGLLASEVKEEVIDVAVGFFERNMPQSEEGDGPRSSGAKRP